MELPFPVKRRISGDTSIPERDDEESSDHEFVAFRQSFDHSELFAVQESSENEDNHDCSLQF